ncbi:MAG: hypothetical protein IKV94_00690 [Clostridia bacterium]|nr:hypothetical protein [Clostridia bacterium]
MYKPECKYEISKNTSFEYLNECKVNNQAVVGYVTKYDFDKKALIVDLGNGITANLPEEFIDPSVLKFPVPGSYSMQAHNVLNKTILAYVEEIKDYVVVLNRARLHEDITKNIDRSLVYNVHIKGISKHGLYVDIAGGAMGFIPMDELSTTFFNNLNDIGIYINDFIPATFIQCNNKKQLYPTLSYRKAFKNFALPEGSCILGVVRQRIPDSNEFWVEINPNSKGIISITDEALNYVKYGSTVLCKVLKAMPTEQEDGTLTVSYKLEFIAKQK